MSSAALQEQENNQPLLTHVILTDSEDPEPIACFSVDTYRPTTTSLVLHHAYANRLPRAALVCQKVFALAAVTWDSAGCLEPLSWWTKPIPSTWGHVLPHVVGFLLGTAKIPNENKGPLGQILYGQVGKDGVYPKQAKGTIMSMFHYRELTYSPEQRRDPGTIATINLPFQMCFPSLSDLLSDWVRFPYLSGLQPTLATKGLAPTEKTEEQWFDTMSQTFLWWNSDNYEWGTEPKHHQTVNDSASVVGSRLTNLAVWSRHF